MAAVKKTEKERIKELEELTPELPKNFKEWCGEKFKTPEIYYKRKGNFAECACGKCGGKYEIYTPKEPEYGTLYDEIPRRGERAVCKKCGNISTYQWKRITEPVRESARFYLYQRSKDNNLFVRIFTYYRKYSQSSKMEELLEEDSRYFLQLGKVEKMVRSYTYRQDEYQWIMSDRTGYPYLETLHGDLYPGWREEIKQSKLKYFPEQILVEMAMSNWGRQIFNGVSMTDAIMTYANNPAIELYCKMEMHRLVRHLIWKEGRSGLANRKKDTLQGQLRLEKKENINKVIKAAGDLALLETLQFEEKEGYAWKPEQEEWIVGIFDREMKKRIKHLLKYMTLQQLINRTEKYARQKYGENYTQAHNWKEHVIQEYDDYLNMREELGYDMKNSVFIYPRNLEEAHNQMVKESTERHDELFIKKKNKEFSEIAVRYKSLCKRYQASAEGYIIRPAKDAGEIIIEGRVLHHCVGGDNYLSKHNKGTTTILFLRKEKTPDTPYITIEIKGTEIRQWYGAHDKKPKQEFFDRFLKDYTAQLKNREKKPEKAGQALAAV
nr:MAG TPA: PcfJ like protein [Caudoviricetes sp.]